MSAFGNGYIGCLLTTTQAVIAAVDPKLADQKIDSSFILRWADGAFSAPIGLNWTACGLVRPAWNGVECVAVGAEGSIALLRSDGSTQVIADAFGIPRGKGAMLKAVAVRGGSIIAVGTNFICRELDSALKVTDHSPMRAGGNGPAVGFEAVCASDQAIYCAGWEGEIWVLDAGGWTRESTPTNMIFTSLCVSPDGNVHAVGQAATYVVGKPGQWRAIPQQIAENLWSSVWFEDTLYAASTQQLFVLDGDEFCSVELPDNPASFFHLSVAGDSLLSTGANDVLLLLPDRMIKLD